MPCLDERIHSVCQNRAAAVDWSVIFVHGYSRRRIEGRAKEGRREGRKEERKKGKEGMKKEERKKGRKERKE